MSVNNMMLYNDMEFCIIIENPAIKQARQLINQICIPKTKKEDGIVEKTEFIDGPIGNREYHSCQNCTKKKIKTRFLKSTMLPIPRETKQNGKVVTILHYLCPACSKNYKPKQRVTRVIC